MKRFCFGLTFLLSLLALMSAGGAVDRPDGTLGQVILFGIMGLAFMGLAIMLQKERGK